mgnify:CR=1 FL=1
MEPEHAAFEIKTEGERVFLRTMRDGVNPAAVLESLLQAGVTASYAQVEEILSLEPGPWRPIDRGEEDFRMEVRILADGLSAEARLLTGSGQSGQEEEREKRVRQILAEAGVTFGVLEEAVFALAREQVPLGTWTPVAVGIPPKDGVDARIEELVPDPGESRGENEGSVEKARVDPRERNLIRNVKKGEAIARKIPLIEGQEGKDVSGRGIPAKKAKDVRLVPGPNTELSEDGLMLSASAGGHLVRENGRFSVQRVFEVRENVDYGTGNLECEGGILVRGSVAEGFSLKAREDLEVHGIVEGATLSAGGRMILKSSVRGMGRGVLSCGGDLFVEYADQCRIRAGKDVRFGKALLHCDLEAEGSILADREDRGVIVGGVCKAGGTLACTTLGSEMGAKTIVQVGLSPKLLEKKGQLSRKKEELLEKEARIRKNISFLAKQAEQKGLSSSQELLARELIALSGRVREEIEKAESFLQEIEKAIQSAKNRGEVLVRGYCYPEVTVIIRGEALVVREVLEGVRFVYRDGMVRLLPLKD